LDGHYTSQHYPEHLRRIRLRDTETRRTLVFLTNQFGLPAATICALYKSRWQVELFFKWIKQHLRIKRFFGTSENAVKTHSRTAGTRWLAVSEADTADIGSAGPLRLCCPMLDRASRRGLISETILVGPRWTFQVAY
jgi:Transposase DDE domain